MHNNLARIFFITLFLNVLSGFCTAHETRPAALHIVETTAGVYSVNWKVPAKEQQRLKLDVRLNNRPIFSPLQAHFKNGAYIAHWQFEKPEGLKGATITIEGLDKTLTDVILRFEDLQGKMVTARISPEDPHYVFTQQASGWELAKTYTELGIEHILSGIDHLLFVACLVFIAGFGRRLFWAISGFTLAHSITLALSALQLFRLPVPPVEAAIALSIVFLAVEIVKHKPDSLSYRYPVLISSIFGLLHGFGFAAVLANIGLPEQETLSALLCFNLGVEIGQLIFVAVLISVLFVLQKIQYFNLKRIEKVLSYLMGSIAVMWLFERMANF